MAQDENWSALIDAARQAGFQVKERGKVVQIGKTNAAWSSFPKTIRNQGEPGYTTGYDLARVWLQRQGVQIATTKETK